MKITKDQRELLSHRLNHYGVEDTFVNYSIFADIEDEIFHKMRQHYVAIHEEFKTYLEEQGLMHYDEL